jgi:hypothetical protein
MGSGKPSAEARREALADFMRMAPWMMPRDSWRGVSPAMASDTLL